MVTAGQVRKRQGDVTLALAAHLRDLFSGLA